jgi:uncharacterized RDD family membrane protein YckC
MDRRILGSWLGGPRSAALHDRDPADHPGRRLGLPSSGVGAIAGVGRRLTAFALDTVLCWLSATVMFPGTVWGVTAVFALEVVVLSTLLGGSAGQVALRLRLITLLRRPAGLREVLIRTALLLLLVPALIWDRDGRGLHDKAAGTVLVRV